MVFISTRVKLPIPLVSPGYLMAAPPNNCVYVIELCLTPKDSPEQSSNAAGSRRSTWPAIAPPSARVNSSVAFAQDSSDE